jgi:Ni/Fe-hydrogenase subunit HybB-like protein
MHNEPTGTNDAVVQTTDYVMSYPAFLWRALQVATDGGPLFYGWMTALTAVWLVGVNAFSWQLVNGQGVTAMTDHVSWGMYIGNFTYAVGIAAGAVMMVIPAYLYRDKEMHDVVIVGEILAVSAVAVALSFVNVDIGRLDRLWHMMPVIGRFHWPVSMLTWDVIVLSGYLLINLHVVGYLLYTRFLGLRPNPRWYVPFVFLSIVWAVSIHTVTAFLYSGLGSRPFWNQAILAPRFIASAFVTGPAFIVLALQVIRRLTDFHVGDGPIRTLVAVLRVTTLLNLFMVFSEVFTELYSGGSHTAASTYLWFGLHGKDALVPWMWSAMAMEVVAATLFLTSSATKNLYRIDLACLLVLAGIWIEKGLGLIVPGFVPSTLHELVEYLPNQLEWKVSLGIWAMGLMIYTLGLKVAIATFTGRMSAGRP